MLSILLLTAEPKDLLPLRLSEEAKQIHEQLQRGKFRDRFSLHQRTCIRPTDLTQAMLDLNPDIVHFSGHASQSGSLCLEGNDGLTKYIPLDALAGLFQQFRDSTKCVLLNACYTEPQARRIADHINFVIGMNTAIGDQAAIAFTTGFYQALGAGRPTNKAYELGCLQMILQGFAGQLTPVLFRKEGAGRVVKKRFTWLSSSNDKGT